MGGHLCLLCFIRQARVLIFLRKKTWNFLECSKNYHNTLKYQNTSYSVTGLICASPKWILSKTVTTQNNITNTRGAQIELFMLEFIFIVFKFQESDQKEQIGCWIWSWWTTGFSLNSGKPGVRSIVLTQKARKIGIAVFKYNANLIDSTFAALELADNRKVGGVQTPATPACCWMYGVNWQSTGKLKS